MTPDIPRRGTPSATPQPIGIGDLEEAYLKRSIDELTDLQSELSHMGDGDAEELPVHPSGSPQAEIFMLKWASSLAERQEGVAFFGRAGSAILKSVQRLGIDPLSLYGTLCAKRSDWDQRSAMPWVERELQIVRPKLVVVMGEDALATMNALNYPLAAPLTAEVGTIQQWTPTIEAILVPDIDQSLDEQNAKRAFWAAFRAIGEWFAAQPPY